MFFKLTDLAVEKNTQNESAAEVLHGVNVTYSVFDEAAHYTLDVGKIWLMDGEMRKARAEAVAEVLGRLIPDGASVTVVGLGNRNITADSIGPMAADKVIVTRHIRRLDPNLYGSLGFGEVSAFAAGVLGQTGIESASLATAVVESIKPDAVIVVDALASRALDRLCTTVQISDGGITPGSGVHNRRCTLSKDVLGVPTVAIGIPTVVDAATLVSDVLDESGIADSASLDSLKEAGVYVTLKEADTVVKEMSRLIADGINLAFHKKIPYEDINEYRTL